MKFAILILAATLAAPAFAESAASSGAQSTANASPNNIGNPTVNVLGSTQAPVTAARVDSHTNQAATAPTVFVNPPAADTCERAGVGVSGGWVTGNAGLNIPRGQSDKCDMRADTINLKVTGAPQDVIKARHCMDAAMAEAYARAGQPCRDERQEARAAAILNGQSVSEGVGVARQPMPWQAGG